jgi:membrane associated rhomboid family serine protease
MTREEKIATMINDLSLKGLGPYTSAPPLYRLLWRLGFDVPPPPFASFMSNALVMGIMFGIVWGLLMWFILWQGEFPVVGAIFTAVVAGVCFGLAMAAYYRWRVSKLGLPRWEDYPAAPK